MKSSIYWFEVLIWLCPPYWKLGYKAKSFPEFVTRLKTSTAELLAAVKNARIERSICVWAFHFQRIPAGSHVQFSWVEHYPGIRRLVAVTRPQRMVGWWNKWTNKQEERFNFASMADIQDLELRPRDKNDFSQQAIFISNFPQFTSLS